MSYEPFALGPTTLVDAPRTLTWPCLAAAASGIVAVACIISAIVVYMHMIADSTTPVHTFPSGDWNRTLRNP